MRGFLSRASGLTFVEVEDGEGDLVRPGRALLQSDAVPAAAEQLPGGDQLAVLSRLEFQPRRVPDERHQLPGKAPRLKFFSSTNGLCDQREET